MQRPRRQRPLLHDPRAPMQRRPHPPLRTRPPHPLILRPDAIPTVAVAQQTRREGQWIARHEATAVAICGAERRDGARCVAVDVAHGRGFAGPVVWRVLDDAEGVNPEVCVAEAGGGEGSVAEVLWKGGEREIAEEGGKGGGCEFEDIGAPPTVAEGQVRGAWFEVFADREAELYRKEEWAVCGDFQEAGWDEVISAGAVTAFLVMVKAGVEPAFRELENFICICSFVSQCTLDFHERSVVRDVRRLRAVSLYVHLDPPRAIITLLTNHPQRILF